MKAEAQWRTLRAWLQTLPLVKAANSYFPWLQVSNVHSQQMDDLFDILIKSGGRSEAGQEPVGRGLTPLALDNLSLKMEVVLETEKWTVLNLSNSGY